jgi:predicted Zn finger-like uncharacterized protein
MTEVIQCPQCQRQLRVPEELRGKAVKCPSCSHTFTAPLAGAADTPAVPPPPPGQHDAEEPPRPSTRRPRPPQEDYGEEPGADYDDEPWIRRRLDAVPHRGGLILTLGILSLVCCGIICGPIAWVMGNNDMREIRAGRMDPEGEGLTNAGRICGIVGTCLGIVGLICGVIQFAAMLATQGRLR